MPQSDWFEQNKPKDDWFAQNAPKPLPELPKNPRETPSALKPDDPNWNVKDFATGKGGLIRTGLGEAVGGIEHMAQPGSEAKYAGASQAIRGVGKAAIPAAIPFAAAAPLATATGAAAGYVGGKVGKYAAKQMGASPGAQDLTEDLASIPAAALGGWVSGALKSRGADFVLDAVKKRYGLTEIDKVPKETQKDIAFALYQEKNGAAPSSASQKVTAIKEMREALKATPKPKAAAPAPAPKSPSWKPAEPPAAKPGLLQKPMFPERSGTATGAKPVGTGSTVNPAAQLPSPKGKLSAPGVKSDIDTTTGEVVNQFTNVKRDTVAKALVENEKMTGEQFLKLSVEEQNKLIKKYWPKHELKPNKLTKDPAKLKEYADRIDKLRAK